MSRRMLEIITCDVCNLDSYTDEVGFLKREGDGPFDICDYCREEGWQRCEGCGELYETYCERCGVKDAKACCQVCDQEVPVSELSPDNLICKDCVSEQNDYRN